MKLTKKQLESIPPLYSQEDTENPTAHIHFFNPLGRGDWYVVEGRPEGKDILFFGYCKSPLGSDCDEWGYFTLDQLKSTRVIELDKYFTPKPIKELI